MKRIFTIALVMLFAFSMSAQNFLQTSAKPVEDKNAVSVNTFAQSKALLDYQFTETAGTFTSISGTGTSLGGGDDANYVLDLSGTYSFLYNGVAQTSFSVNTNGTLQFGADYITLTNDLASSTLFPLVALCWDDMVVDGGCYYQIDGSVLTFEWNQIRRYGGSNYADIQVKLDNSTGAIQIIYNGMANASGWSASASIGINDQENGSTVFWSVTPGSPATVSNSVANNTIDGATLATIADGTTYTFVAVSVDNDLSCSSVTPMSLQSGETVTPTATVSNPGVNTQDDFSVTVVINDGTSDVYTSTKAVTGANLAHENSVEVTMDDDWTPATGTYTITGTVTLSGDENTDNDTYSTTCNVFNGLWTVSTETMDATYLQAAAYDTTNNILYSIGGNGTLTTLSIYDVVNDTWTTGATLPNDVLVGSACYGNGYVYVHPGSIGGSYTNAFWIYDVANDSWNDAAATLPVSFGWSKMAYCPTHDGVYIAGGNDGSAALSDVYFYDIANDTWTAATSLPNGVFGGVLTIVDGNLYYLGGVDDTDNYTATVHKGEIDDTDPLTITWTTVADMPYAAYKHHGAPFGDGKIIVNGGNIGTGGSYWSAEASTYIYDIADDSWSQAADKTTPTLGGAEGSFFIDNNYTFVVASGYDGTAAIDHAEIYTEPYVSTPEYKTIDVSISPNPTSGMIRVAADGDYTVEVMDITGKIISSSNMKNETNIDISAQNAGVYIVRLSNETETSSFKVIKK